MNLSRLYTAGSPKRFNSLWEFGIEVKGLRDPGTYTVRLAGIDSNGNPVPETDTVFMATVVPRTFPSSWSVIAHHLRMRLVYPPDTGNIQAGEIFSPA